MGSLTRAKAERARLGEQRTVGGDADLGHGIALQSDGKILVAGYASMGTTDVAVVRYNSDGRIQFEETWAVPPSAAPLRSEGSPVAVACRPTQLPGMANGLGASPTGTIPDPGRG